MTLRMSDLVDDPRTIGQKVKNLRILKGVTTSRMAADLAVPESDILWLEQDEMLPSYMASRQIADYFDVAYDDLFNLDDMKEQTRQLKGKNLELMLKMEKMQIRTIILMMEEVFHTAERITVAHTKHLCFTPDEELQTITISDDNGPLKTFSIAGDSANAVISDIVKAMQDYI